MTMKQDLANIVGAAAVSEEEADLAPYAGDRSYTDGYMPALRVRPQTADQVRRIILTAGTNGFPLVPVSSRPPGFRGDAVPSVEGAVIVDLSAMNKIEWINRRDRVTVVEPGVTFGQLEPELEKEGLRILMPLLPRAGQSVVGAFMEREPFTGPRYAWDLSDPVASAEIILGDGYPMRTGGGAGPGPTREKQRQVGGAHKLPFAPFAMDVKRMAQGSCGGLGICTWQALRCELLPEQEEVFFAGSSDPARLMNAAYRLLYLRLTDEQYLVNNLTLAALWESDPQKIEALRGQLPEWILVCSIAGYGTLAREQFAYKAGDLADESRSLGLDLQETVGGISGEHYRRKLIRKVSGEPFWKVRLRGDCREVLFLAPTSRVAEFITTAREVVDKAGFRDLGVYVQQVIQGTACQVGFDFQVAPAKTLDLHPLYRELSQKIYSLGGYFSRPYGEWADLVYPDAEVFVKYARHMKDLFDPAHIMNPEKLCFKGM